MTDTIQHTTALRRQLASLAGIKASARYAEGNIQDAAGKRLEAVDADLAAIKPRVYLDDGAAKQYEDLTLERGRLNNILIGAKP